MLRIEFNQTDESASIYFGQKDRDGNNTIWVTRKELLEVAGIPRNEVSEKLVVKLIKETRVPKCITPRYKERDAVWISLARKQLTKAENEFVNKL